MSIAEKAMKAQLHISCYTGRIKDDAVTEKTNQDYQAVRDAGAYSKLLIKKTDLHPISSAASEARKFHRERTLPWGDHSERILPAAELQDYSAAMRNYQAKFENAVADFILKYPELVKLRQIELGQMNNPDEYPTVDKIRDKFKFEVVLDPIETSQDFRVKLSDFEVERIKKEISLREQKNHKMAVTDLWDRLYKVVSDMAKKLSEEVTYNENGRPITGVFRDSLVGNVESLTALLPKLNIDNDPDLNKLCANVTEQLCAYTPKQLRENEASKKEAAKRANDILAAMSGYIGDKAA